MIDKPDKPQPPPVDVEPTPLPKRLSERVCWTVACVAGVALLTLSALLLATYLQLRNHDPLENPALLELRRHFATQSTEPVIREGIRALDLQVRRAFFLGQAQLQFGSYLVMALTIVFIAAVQLAKVFARRRMTLPRGEVGDAMWRRQQVSRHMMGVAALLLAALGVTAAYLADPQLAAFDEQLAAALGTPATTESQPTILPPAPVAISNPEPQPVKPGPDPFDLQPVQPRPVKPRHNPEPTPVATAAPTTLPGTNQWPAFRGPGGQARASNATPPREWDGAASLNIRWKTPVPRSGFNSPVVWGDRIYLTGADDKVREVYAFDANSGKRLWSVPATASRGKLEELPDVMDETGFAAPTAATDGRHVCAIFATGDLICLTPDGKEVWSRFLGVLDNYYGHSSSLLMFDGKVFIQLDQSEDARLLAIDAATGETVWEKERPGSKISWTSPLLIQNDNRVDLLVSGLPFLTCYNPLTGEQHWQTKCLSGEVGPSAGFAAGRVFVANEYAKVVAMDARNGNILWEKDDDDLPNTVSLLATGQYLWMEAEGVLTCLRATDGEVVYKHVFKKDAYASPVQVGERVYRLDRAGVMHVFKAGETYEPVTTAPLGEPSVCTPAFVGNRIYMRGMKHLYCIEESLAEPQS